MTALLVVAYLAFVGLGLPDGVLGVAWPSIRTAFALEQSGLGAVLIAGGAGYFLSSFLSGPLTSTLGIGSLLAVSSGLVTIGILGFATAPAWEVFVACAALIGAGSGAIDAGLNSYAASNFRPRHVNWLHAFYGVGAAFGPIIMTITLAQGLSWRWGYAVVGTVLAGLALTFSVTRSAWRLGAADRPERRTENAKFTSVLRRPLVWLQIAIFFVYTGIEVTAGQWSYSIYTEARGLPRALAGAAVGLYWGAFTFGRFLAGFAVERLGVDRLLRSATLGMLVGAVAYAAGPPAVSLAGLALLGLSLAPVFPCLMAETPRRLGAETTAHAVGFQVSAAMVGAAGLPALSGLSAARFGLEIIPIIVVAAVAILLLVHEVLVRLTEPAKALSRQ